MSAATSASKGKLTFLSFLAWSLGLLRTLWLGLFRGQRFTFGGPLPKNIQGNMAFLFLFLFIGRNLMQLQLALGGNRLVVDENGDNHGNGRIRLHLGLELPNRIVHARGLGGARTRLHVGLDKVATERDPDFDLPHLHVGMCL